MHERSVAGLLNTGRTGILCLVHERSVAGLLNRGSTGILCLVHDRSVAGLYLIEEAQGPVFSA